MWTHQVECLAPSKVVAEKRETGDSGVGREHVVSVLRGNIKPCLIIKGRGHRELV